MVGEVLIEEMAEKSVSILWRYCTYFYVVFWPIQKVYSVLILGPPHGARDEV